MSERKKRPTESERERETRERSVCCGRELGSIRSELTKRREKERKRNESNHPRNHIEKNKRIQIK